jgi:formylglycine-generating enzyme required for sulfatase activity
VVLYCFSLFSDRGKSEFNRLERLAEANAKAEREAEPKLTTEIVAGRIGASLSVPLLRKVVMPFNFCPAGSFLMGSPSSEVGRGCDENQVPVTLTKDFWMAKTEVTQAQWRAVMGSELSQFTGDELPVENVSWDDAQEFIEKMNGSGIMPNDWKMVLPTEAQWEYACRAGGAEPYAGFTIDEVAWYNVNSGKKTHKVGTKKSNSWGLYDLQGNVSEWCADWYGYTLSGGTDPSGPSSGVGRVIRGGSWNDNAVYCRAAYRYWNDPGLRLYSMGFRPALVPSK